MHLLKGKKCMVMLKGIMKSIISRDFLKPDDHILALVDAKPSLGIK